MYVCMYVCMYVYVHIYIYICISVYSLGYITVQYLMLLWWYGIDSRYLSLTHSLAHSLTRSLAHSLTHSLARSLARSLTHSLTGAIPPESGIGGAAHHQVRIPLSRPEQLYVRWTLCSPVHVKKNCVVSTELISSIAASSLLGWKSSTPAECICAALGLRTMSSRHRTFLRILWTLDADARLWERT